MNILIAGGGAAGIFAANICAECGGGHSIVVCEATAHLLSKVRISGGGRCNVTHRVLGPKEFASHYPRGGRELVGPLTRFGPREVAEWFEARGVRLKVEEDGRVFPATDDSQTIVDCLLRAAATAGVSLRTGCAVRHAGRAGEGGFEVALSSGETVRADRLLIATGGTRGSAGPEIARSLGHTIMPPVPSLFTFRVDDARLKDLAGVSVPRAGVEVAATKLRANGPLLITHWGLSGPAILRVSAWGARELHAKEYRFELVINWTGALTREAARERLVRERGEHAKRLVTTSNPFGLPARLWERLAAAAGIAASATWANVPNAAVDRLAGELAAGRFAVTGKSLNQDEFVTCGGVSLREVDFATMESRLVPGLHFAGEALDIDGLTGGFNFQAAWTTAWHAGRAMALPPAGHSRR